VYTSCFSRDSTFLTVQGRKLGAVAVPGLRASLRIPTEVHHFRRWLHRGKFVWSTSRLTDEKMASHGRVTLVTSSNVPFLWNASEPRVLVSAPTARGSYSTVLLLHGFALPPKHYESLMRRLSAENLIVVAPAMYNTGSRAQPVACMTVNANS